MIRCLMAPLRRWIRARLQLVDWPAVDDPLVGDVDSLLGRADGTEPITWLR